MNSVLKVPLDKAPVLDPADPAVLRFLDAVWMERGLSANTLAAKAASTALQQAPCR